MRRPERIAPCGAEAQLFAGACQMLKSHQPSSIMLKHKLMRRVMAIARVAGPDGHPVLVLYLVQADTPSPGLCILTTTRYSCVPVRYSTLCRLKSKPTYGFIRSHYRIYIVYRDAICKN